MTTEKISAIGDGRRVWTTALPGLDQDGGALLLGLSAVYDSRDQLLYREMHRKRDLEDVWMQHDGIVAGVREGYIRLTTPAQRERERAPDREPEIESERCGRSGPHG